MGIVLFPFEGWGNQGPERLILPKVGCIAPEWQSWGSGFGRLALESILQPPGYVTLCISPFSERSLFAYKGMYFCPHLADLETEAQIGSGHLTSK